MTLNRTFHSYASTFLRQVGASILGRSPHYSLWDHEQAKEAITAMLDVLNQKDDTDEDQPEPDDPESDEPESVPKMTGNEINNFLQWYGLNRARWGQEITAPDIPYWHHLIELYTQEKLRQNAMDLDDLIPLAVHALEENPQLRTTWSQIRSKHLMVDEFQDITPIQYRLLQLITNTNRSIAIATDPNQAIYSWRGADTRMLDQFRLDHHNAEIHMLHLNHRATETLVDLAAQLTEDESMTGLINAYQQPLRPRGPKPVLLTYDGNHERMSQFILAEAQRMVDRGQLSWQDMAIVYRNRDAKKQLLHALLRENIPYRILGDVKKIDQGTI